MIGHIAPSSPTALCDPSEISPLLFPSSAGEEIDSHVFRKTSYPSRPRLLVLVVVALLVSTIVALSTAYHTQSESLFEFESGDTYKAQLNTIRSLESQLHSEQSQRAADVAEARRGLAILSEDLSRTANLLGRTEVELQDCEKRGEALESELAQLRPLMRQLARCHDEARDARKDSEDAWRAREVCLKEKERQEKVFRKGLKIDVVEVTKRLGTGGDSLVCSDAVASWSFGYASTVPVHPTFPIRSLIIPFTSATGILKITRDNFSTIPDARVHIVGYTVRATQRGGNGWWRRTGLDEFGGDSVDFQAEGTKLWAAKYEAELYFLVVED